MMQADRVIVGVAWAEVVLGGLVAVLVGIALWLFLPRGVVLTRTARTRDWRGEPLYDTWEIKNASAVPARILSVTVRGAHTYDEATDRILEVPLTEGHDGVTLIFDDEIDGITWQEVGNGQWPGTVIRPGDSLQAQVMNNRDLRIRYRRAGWTGVLERRELLIHGNV